jgi:hypothetical protein
VGAGRLLKMKNLRHRSALLTGSALLFAGAVAATLGLKSCQTTSEFAHVEGLPEVVDFNFHVRPILSDRCYACHGPASTGRKANLRLDTEEGALQLAAESGKVAIDAGDVHGSELWARINHTDPDMLMPPPESNLKLSDYEKAVLGKWIEQGAKWKPHWSFIPPQKAEAPAVKNQAWPKNDIDRYVLARLEREGLAPQPEADPAKLIRRVTFDLTGLPPTPQEVTDFLNDKSPNAFEKVVDRLLASPRFGERMASVWLDVARYADTHGYQDDMPRTQWPWRNWVIEAYNRNLPFNEFVTWQLAGDLLPNATYEQILATGFNRNHAISQEGGIIDEEYRVEYVADRTNTFSAAFLGLTFECARCHDHKYDPLMQKEYYQLYAFFNNVPEDGWIPYRETPGPALEVTTPAQREQLAAIKKMIAEKEQELARVANSPATQARYAPPAASLNQGLVLHITAEDKVRQRTSYPWWDKAKKNPFQQKFTPGQPGGKFSVILEGDTVPPNVPGKIGQAYLFKGDNQLTVADTAVGDFERYQPFSVNTWVRIDKKDKQFGLVTKLCEDNDGKAGWELSVHMDSLLVRITNVWPYNTLCVSSKTTIPVGEWAHVGFTYDGSSRAAGIRMFINGQEAPGRVHFDRLYRSIKALNRNRNNNGIRVGRRFYHGGLVGALDDVRVYARQLTGLEMAQLAQQPATAQAQAEHAKMTSPVYQKALAELTAVRQQECDLRHPWIETLVMAERDTVRPSFILDRGAYDAHKERVTPGTPEKVLNFANLPPNRLGLARWLFSEQNPLVGRVTVNRYWQMLFGRGIVGTVEDFGNQGTLPTHPELLDWLAVTYREKGWDTKQLLKTIVLSATYRQASRTPAALRERDPDNALLARGPSHRLPAEMLRDNALFTSGLLVEKVGGPSVFPYQPDGIWEATTSGRGLVTYQRDQGEGLYRRSLYTYWKRTVPPPAMITLDAAARTLCAVKRQATSTPLQGLVLLNDPQMVEASRVLAEKLLAQGAVVVGGDTDPIGEAFFRLVSRRIQPSERQVLYDLYTEELANFGRNPQAAAKLLATGDAPRNPKLNPAQHAALTLVVSTIYNLDEAVTKR